MIIIPKQSQTKKTRTDRLVFFVLVLVMGVEPIRPFELGILSPVRLPFRHTSIYSKKDDLKLNWRYHPDLNRGIKVLQTFALPLGHGTVFNFLIQKVQSRLCAPSVVKIGAEDEIRTRDVHLGKVTLYH